jgi:hypothetical protein
MFRRFREDGRVPVAFHFDFDSEHKILRSRFEGHINDDEIRRHYKLSEGYIERLVPLGGILDMSGVSGFDVTLLITVRELAHAQPAFSDPRIPRVLIAPAPLVFGLARLFQLEGEDKRPNLHVVRSKEEALAILGIDNASFNRMPSI